MRKSIRQTIQAAAAVAVVLIAAHRPSFAQEAPPANPVVPNSALSFPCGGTNPKGVVLYPVTKFTNAEFTNAGADCAMWQNFIYLNWPAVAGKRGIPDLTATFGTPGTTVWETFLTVNEVFLPDGAKPHDWDGKSPKLNLPEDVAARIASGHVRLLRSREKTT